MTDPTTAGAGRHHAVLSHLRRDLERDRATPDVLATEITLSALALALDAARDADDWTGAHDHTATRLRSIGIDGATASAWASELVRAAGGPDSSAHTPNGRARRSGRA